MKHIQIIFTDIQPEQQEWTVAHLADAGYEGFEEKDNELIAYIPEQDFDEALLKELAFKYQLQYRKETIAEQNWNEVWESNFPPVIIDDFVAVRADFHDPIKEVQFEILITPKMSFGTGHHATTSMMIQQMRTLALKGKKVFDFGTGTGILAILAEKMGADSIVAADSDDWSIENARENIKKNHCTKVLLKQLETMENELIYDVILANINKNVIVEQFPFLAEKLAKGGSLVVSGLLIEDKSEVLDLGKRHDLRLFDCSVKGDWLSMRFDC